MKSRRVTFLAAFCRGPAEDLRFSFTTETTRSEDVSSCVPPLNEPCRTDRGSNTVIAFGPELTVDFYWRANSLTFAFCPFEKTHYEIFFYIIKTPDLMPFLKLNPVINAAPPSCEVTPPLFKQFPLLCSSLTDRRCPCQVGPAAKKKKANSLLKSQFSSEIYPHFASCRPSRTLSVV